MGFLVRVAVTGFALWVVTLIVPGVSFVGGQTTLQRIGIIGFVALIFGVVNAVIKPIVAVLSIPFYILTLGLFHVVVNARTDLFLRGDGDESDRVERAITRLRHAAEAGADVLYPVGRHDPDTMRRLTSELPLPVNAIAVPQSDDPTSFGPLGVGRISFGPFWQAALAERAKEILARWQ